MRIATPGSAGLTSAWNGLHPVFGPGEDRNDTLANQHGDPAALHPVFGPGEDRNQYVTTYG